VGFFPSATKFTGTNLNITNCVQSSNGAAIVLERGANVTLNQLTFKGNTNRAIWIKAGANLILDESDFEDNKCSANGGAIFVEGDSKILILKSNFKSRRVQCKYQLFVFACASFLLLNL